MDTYPARGNGQLTQSQVVAPSRVRVPFGRVGGRAGTLQKKITQSMPIQPSSSTPGRKLIRLQASTTPGVMTRMHMTIRIAIWWSNRMVSILNRNPSCEERVTKGPKVCGLPHGCQTIAARSAQLSSQWNLALISCGNASMQVASRGDPLCAMAATSTMAWPWSRRRLFAVWRFAATREVKPSCVRFVWQKR